MLPGTENLSPPSRPGARPTPPSWRPPRRASAKLAMGAVGGAAAGGGGDRRGDSQGVSRRSRRKRTPVGRTARRRCPTLFLTRSREGTKRTKSRRVRCADRQNNPGSHAARGIESSPLCGPAGFTRTRCGLPIGFGMVRAADPTAIRIGWSGTGLGRVISISPLFPGAPH